jgi:glyoxylase-like metal-dependent hydrolase (beta-lactamase superfamily II)
MRSRIRITLWIALSLIGVLVVAVLVFELPAHWQVRQVEPPLPSLAQLRALQRPDGPVAIRYLNTSEQASAAGVATHSVFVVEWANGDLFMIDAGMTEAAAARFGAMLERVLDAQPARVHGTVASLLGAEVRRVQGVGFTHLHSDHTEGMLAFCEARGAGAMLLQTRWQATQHNFSTRGGAELLRESCLQPAPLSAGIVQTSPRFPGLGIIAVGGHTPDSTLFAIALGDRLYLLSGDITNSKAEIDGDLPKPLLYSYLIVPEHVPRMSLLRRWLKDLGSEPNVRVVVSHDLVDVRSSGITPVVLDERPR